MKMAYADPFDTTKPDASHYIDTGPAEIQANERGLQQRLDSFTNFSTSADPATDPVKLNDATVATAMLKDANVTAAKLAADAVETAKIKDGAVTFAKILPATTTKLKHLFSMRISTPSVALAAGAEQTTGAVTFTGVDVGDEVWVFLNELAPAPERFCLYHVAVTGPNTISVTVSNPTAAVRNIGTLDALTLVAMRALS
jgi:hypothetical protein